MGDGCTWWPDGTWVACCNAHDIAYAGDGARTAADLELARCVLAATGNAPLALLMLAGVTIFGGIFRWAARRRRN